MTAHYLKSEFELCTDVMYDFYRNLGGYFVVTLSTSSKYIDLFVLHSSYCIISL